MWKRGSLGVVLSVAVVCLAAAPASAEPFADRTKLLPGTSTSLYTEFGQSVAMDGDSVVVGHPLATIQSVHSGCISVFARSGSSWGGRVDLVPSDRFASMDFGQTVAVSGNYLIAGAVSGGTGSAYVFEHSTAGWTQAAKFVPTITTPDNDFATTLAIDGQYAMVGAPGTTKPSGASSDGVVYIYQRTGGGWVSGGTISPSDPLAGHLFGSSVAIAGDLAVVGAPGDDDKGDRAGAAYVFQRNGTSWQQIAELHAGDGDAADLFGCSVAISGSMVLVGASDDETYGPYSGSAYVFHRDGTAWPQMAKLTASDGRSGSGFGMAVALSDEYAVIGAPADNQVRSAAGAAYVFELGAGQWSPLDKLLPPDGGGCRFGSSVDMGDVEAVIGAPRHTGNGMYDGAAFVYTPEPATLSLLALGALVALRRTRRLRSQGRPWIRPSVQRAVPPPASANPSTVEG